MYSDNRNSRQDDPCDNKPRTGFKGTAVMNEISSNPVFLAVVGFLAVVMIVLLLLIFLG